MLEDAEREGFKGEGRESRIQRPDKVFVEPLRFLYLKTDPFDGFELLPWEVNNEADAEVI